MKTTGAVGRPDEHISKKLQCVIASTGQGDLDFMKNTYHEGPDLGQVPEFLALGSPNPKVTTLQRFLFGLCDTEDAMVLLLHSGFRSLGVKMPCSGSCLQNLICFPAHHFPCGFHHFAQKAQLAPDCCQPGPPLAAPSPLSAELCASRVTASPAPHKANV